jgi:NDP-sugar pyrophosphorylase family protein
MFLIRDKIRSTFFVSNCDIIIDQDLEEVYNYHKKNNNIVTIVSVLKHYKIPYGTIETGAQGLLERLSEKPELTFQINSGMYILEPEVLDYIPINEFFHITELIKKVKLKGENVGVFPVSEGSWKDIGDWGEYLQHIR